MDKQQNGRGIRLWTSMSFSHERRNLDSNFLYHTSCDNCGSSDGLAVYDDGHAYCFVCRCYSTNKTQEKPNTTMNKNRKPAPKGDGFVVGEHSALLKRRIDEDTARKWDYRVGVYRGIPCQVANYKDIAGRVVAQKLRFPDKTFRWLGEPQKAGLFGQHLWRDEGRMLVITEGELDALSVSQLQGNKWPVVSVPNGAQGAAKAIAQQLEWVERFDRVILMFDNDGPGRAAVEEVVGILSPGKAYVAKLALKDANEMLVAGRGDEVIQAIWDAKLWRPDEVVDGRELWDVIVSEDDEGRAVEYPWSGLTAMTMGLRMGEITTLAAGTGIGKSSVCRELAHWLLSKGETVGYIALEESIKRTALGVMSVELNTPLHLSREQVSEEEMRQAFNNTVGSGRFFTYDHFGSLDAENLFQRIRYMVLALGCSWVVLDHLSIVVSGMGEDVAGNERRLIDNVMTKLRSMVEEMGFGLILVSHLKESPDKQSLEEGGATHLNLLRGSRAIGQLSDMVFGLERNQQDPEEKHTMRIRVLKNRYTGETGVATSLRYDTNTGRLKEVTLSDLLDASGDAGGTEQASGDAAVEPPF